MRTVEDAVKEFKGAWPYPQHINIVALIDKGLGGISWTTSINHENKICTRQEFEDYAKIMELNKLNKEAVKSDVKHDAIRGEETASYAMLEQLTLACENNTGNEPSLSCYHYALDKSKAFLDPRTDEEKLIDDVAELINDHIDDDAGSKCLAKEIINKLK